MRGALTDRTKKPRRGPQPSLSGRVLRFSFVDTNLKMHPEQNLVRIGCTQASLLQAPLKLTPNNRLDMQ